MKKQLNATWLAIFAVSGFLAGCVGSNDGSAPTSSGGTTSSSTSASVAAPTYTIVAKTASGAIVSQKIRLLARNADALNQANQLSTQGQMRLQSLASQGSLAASLYSTNGIAADADLNNFYGPNSQPTLNQYDFGSCETFSITAALGYFLYHNTAAISPLDILLQGFVQNGDQAGDDAGNYSGNFAAGWNGVNGPDNVLHRVLNLPGVLYNSPGVVMESWGTVPALNLGYYLNSQADVDMYNKLSNEYEQGNYADTTTAVLTSLPDFNSALATYLQKQKDGEAITSNGNAIGNIDVIFTQGSSAESDSASSKIKQALDNGHKVLIGFNIYDPQVPSSSTCSNSPDANTNGDSYYVYNSASGTLSLTTSSDGNTDAWTKPTGCVLGGHEVLVVGYLQDASGNPIFVIRNSWGAQYGDQGNFYMTAAYADVSVMTINEVYLKG